MTSRIVILGKNGQLSRALTTQLGDRALTFDRSQVDLNQQDFTDSLESLIRGEEVGAVINAAAYTAVDKAEGEGKEEAFRINHEAVVELAAWCAARNLPLVHFSTDYVFDGSGDHPRHERDIPNPINAYGASKLAGEQAIIEIDSRYLIFRTSWVYDAWGRNFFNTILRLLKEKDEIKVVDDQVGAPMYAPHLAQGMLAALERALTTNDFSSGVYHLCSAGETSWFGFAQMIFALARSRDSGEKSLLKCQSIQPIPSSEYPLPAKRPLNSRLDCSKARKIFGVTLPHWEAGLRECFSEKYGRSGLQDQRPQDYPAQRTG